MRLRLRTFPRGYDSIAFQPCPSFLCFLGRFPCIVFFPGFPFFSLFSLVLHACWRSRILVLGGGEFPCVSKEQGKEGQGRLCLKQTTHKLIGNGPNTVWKSTVSNTGLSKFFGPHRVLVGDWGESSVSFLLPSFGDGPNTVSQSTVSNTELSEFFGAH